MKKLFFLVLLIVGFFVLNLLIFIPEAKAISPPASTTLSTSGQVCGVGDIALSPPPQLSWGIVVGAVKYYWKVTDVWTGSDVITAQETISTSVTAPGLSSATEYTWKVKACDNLGECSTWSDECLFATRGNLDPPVLDSPCAGVETSVTPTLKWNPVNKAKKYRWTIEKLDGTFVAQDWPTPTSITLPEGILSIDTDYQWYVYAWSTNSLIVSDQSNICTFHTTAILEKPKLISPSNGATDVPLTPQLKWDLVPGATEYEWEIIGVTSGATTDTYKNIPAGTLTAGTYSWKARAKSGAIFSDWSDEWRFTTLAAVSVCGNNTKEPGEICDGTDLDGQSCITLGYTGGTLACRSDCTAFDTSGCTGPPPVVVPPKIVCPSATCTPGTICIQNPLCAQTFEELISAIINFLFAIGIALAPLMVVIAAFYLTTAGGDPKKIETAKNIILYTFIGLLIILLAKALIAMIRSVF